MTEHCVNINKRVNGPYRYVANFKPGMHTSAFLVLQCFCVTELSLILCFLAILGEKL